MNTPALPPVIDFWFDFSSPYSYVANEWIDALAARHGRTMRRHADDNNTTIGAAHERDRESERDRGGARARVCVCG